MQDWVACKDTQKYVAKWATKCLKDQRFVSTRRVDDVIEELVPSKTTETLFNAILHPVLDKVIQMASFSPKFNKTSYMFARDVGSHYTGMLPSSAGQLRYLVMGEVTMYMFDVAAVKDEKKWGMEDLKAWLAGKLNSTELSEKIPNIVHCKLAKNSILWIPTGWFVLDTASSGPLCYGMRKSVFLNLPSCKTSYLKSKHMFHLDGRDVSKMDPIDALHK